jgi:hypothetical protein
MQEDDMPDDEMHDETRDEQVPQPQDDSCGDGDDGSDWGKRPPEDPWPGGRPFPTDFPDPRTPEQLATDTASVRGQVGALVPDERNDEWRDRATQRLVERRRKSDLPPIELVRDRQGRPVAVTKGELLVRPAVKDSPELWALLMRLSTGWDAVAGLDDRLLLLRSDLPGERLDDLARYVRQWGYEASVTHVAPLAPLVKGEGGPEPASTALPFDAPAGGVRAQVVVSVIDTGISLVDRKDGWLAGLRAPDDSNADPLDAHPRDGLLDAGAGHGTFAAGVVQQVAPGVRLEVRRAVQSDGIGDEVDIAVAMVAAAAEAPEDAALVINLSLGGETLDDQPMLAIEVALEILAERRPEALVVAAAGNTGDTRPVFPAASRSVVAVAALDARGRLTPWSTRGSWVDCSAVGEGILSTFVPGVEDPRLDPLPDTWTDNPWALWSGSSFAAPQVAAAVARVAAEKGCTPREALAALYALAPRVPDAGRALHLLGGTPSA